MLSLNEEYQRLNEEQQEAIRADGNTVVSAGPGSGKTATLVIKIARLLSAGISPPSGLACITYNNDAVREFRTRLAQLGIRPRRCLFLGTVHSFCLNCIVRPYGKLVDPRFGAGIKVAGQSLAEEVLSEAAQRHVANPQTRWITLTMTRYRRARACGEDLTGFADVDPLIAQDYEDLLLRRGLLDFEGIILVALDLIQQHAWIRQLLAARFPWLVVDEYQDLGGPLHRIVTSLVDAAGVKVFAVGDADQTIYDFTGANPRYLVELAARPDFLSLRLKFNYRSGQRIIDASQAALAPTEPRGYRSAPDRKAPGEIFFTEADGTNNDHARKLVLAVQRGLAAGHRPEEIAIFYRSISSLVEAIRNELTRQNIEFVWERDERFPASPFIYWLQTASAWSLAGPELRERTFGDIFREFSVLLNAGGKAERGSESLEYRIGVHEFLTQPLSAGTRLHEWLRRVESALKVRQLLAASEEYASDLEAYDRLIQEFGLEGRHPEALLTEFATRGRVGGKVLLTTLHASKGRQFDVVIIPGCAEGILPSWTWNGRQRRLDPPAAKPLAETRRLFYVGLSRARHEVHLIHSVCFEDRYGIRKLGVSRFIKEIQAKLGQT